MSNKKRKKRKGIYKLNGGWLIVLLGVAIALFFNIIYCFPLKNQLIPVTGYYSSIQKVFIRGNYSCEITLSNNAKYIVDYKQVNTIRGFNEDQFNKLVQKGAQLNMLIGGSNDILMLQSGDSTFLTLENRYFEQRLAMSIIGSIIALLGVVIVIKMR